MEIHRLFGRRFRHRENRYVGATLAFGIELNATADASGWTMSLPGRPNIPLTVKADGDSVIVDSGPFESVLRKGVQVTNHGVYRMQGDKLVGKTIAHYSVKTADSVRRIDSEFTRKP